jgi:hypothetical protein
MAVQDGPGIKKDPISKINNRKRAVGTSLSYIFNEKNKEQYKNKLYPKSEK